MATETKIQTQRPSLPQLLKLPTGLLQRKCACGQHTGAGGECESCRKKRQAGTLQRAAVSNAPVTAVPPIVHEVLRSPGRPLDAATRAYLEPRFGHDFSHVRVHTDMRAAESALAMNALAYTVGRDVIFGTGQFAPETVSGRHLLAHELTHVVQQGLVTSSHELELGKPGDAFEKEAEQTSNSLVSRGTSDKVTNHGRQGIIQRSLLGDVLGGVLGTASGIALGALIGGPLGAVIGGVAGLIGGIAVGNATSTPSRRLTATEITYAREIFLESIDYSVITITRDSIYALGAPKTIGNTIHLKSTAPWNNFKGDTMELSDAGLKTLIHEMTHVWQYQNGGLAYIPLSLIAQLGGWITGGKRDEAYNWKKAYNAGLPWERWNPEQQAEAIEEYNRLLRLTRERVATAADYRILAILLPYVQQVRQRTGAPTFGGQSTTSSVISQ